MNDDLALLESSYWRWYREHRPFDPAGDAMLRREALGMLVSAINSGDLTRFDGAESPLTKKIKAFHLRDSVEMNSNWILSSQTWACPCCNRSKLEISRVGKQGQILCKSVIHHDHMADALKAAFHNVFERIGTEIEQVQGRLLVERIAPAFSAYDEILVCEDCNVADMEAKRLVKAPAFFSFSISQIRAFIQTGNHQPHILNPDSTSRIWASAKPSYELRMKLIHEVALAATTDNHWFESYPHTMNPVPILGRRPWDSVILEFIADVDLCKALSPTTGNKTRNLSRWRTAKKMSAPDRIPPKNFMAMLRSDAVRAQKWDSVADDWCCPICSRTKFETVYMKSGQVVFDPNSRSRSGSWIGASTICGHCTSTIMSLKTEIAETIGFRPEDSYSIATVEELAAIIEPRPHSAHQVRHTEADALVSLVIQRLSQE
jgi:rubredoxin